MPADQRLHRRDGAWSMRTHLLTLVLVGMAVVATGATYAYFWSAGQARADAVERMTFQSERAAASIAGSVETALKSVTALAAQPGLVAVLADPTGCTLMLDGTRGFPGARLDVVSAAGVVACSSDTAAAPQDSAAHADAGWLAQTLTGDATAVHDDSVDAVANERAIAVTAPIPASDGTTSPGAVVIFLHHGRAAAALTEDFGSSAQVRFALVDRQDREVLSSNWDSTGSGDETKRRVRAAGRSGTLTTGNGEQLIYGSADVPDSAWTVAAALPHAAVFGEARGALVRQIALGALALVVLVVGVWMLNRRISRPLQAVIRAAHEASMRSDPARVEEAGTAETVALARSYNAMIDIRAAHEAQLAYQVTHDRVTGLPNRDLALLRLERALASDFPVAVVSLGLEGLTRINDALGHDAGERLLRDVAERLAPAIRPGDTLAHAGGHQFMVLCEQAQASDAVAVAVRLQEVLAKPFHASFGDVSLAAIVGIATGMATTTTARRLLREADTAAHEAKSSDRTYDVYDEAMQSRATAHLTIQRDLAVALESDQFVVHYQPLIALDGGAVVGAEALVRWNHPERGMVPPNDFISVAEQTGQIRAIGELVLNRACEQAVRWLVAGHRLTVSVNVAAAQLRDGDFPSLVQRALAASGLPADQLCLEITESSLMTGSAQLDQDLLRLRHLGVHLALDDFGTGYSSLAYLQQLPCDELKIDRAFISRMQQDNRELHVVTAILGMARALELTVVAEGVETDDQRRLLADLGCQQAQGYLFSRPVPATEFTSLLTTQVRSGSSSRHVRATLSAHRPGG